MGAIFERYQQELYRFCLGLLGEPQDAQDALQNTMVKALRALPGEKREIALRPWLYRVAHNEAISLRRSKRETQMLDRQLPDARSGVAERAEHRERLQWLLRDLNDLPERQQAVLVMRELSGLDFADIGAALGTSGAVVRQALYEARRNLGQMDFGRSLRCEAVAGILSDADGRVSSRREIRAHLRDCPDCRRFQDRIQARKEAFAGIAPLPAGAVAGFLQAGLAGAGGSETSGIAATLAGGATQSVGAVGLFKAVATVATVAVIGTAAVERNLHEHRAVSDARTAPLTQRGHAVHATSPAARPHSPRPARLAAHSAPAVPAVVATRAPLSTVVGPSSSAPSRRNPPSDVRRPTPGSSRAVPSPAGGESPSPVEAMPEPPEGQPRTEEQAESVKPVDKQEEQPANAEAKGTPEHPANPQHPAHPEHPAHPPHPQTPVEPSPASEERPQEVVAPSALGTEEEFEVSSHRPNGKAKGYEKRLSG